jgi:hypothetical protein
VLTTGLGTALQHAIHWYDKETVQLLLSKDVDINKVAGHRGW